MTKPKTDLISKRYHQWLNSRPGYECSELAAMCRAFRAGYKASNEDHKRAAKKAALRAKVFSALDIAINESDFKSLVIMTPDKVACTLVRYSSDLENESVRKITECVVEYQKEKK